MAYKVFSPGFFTTVDADSYLMSQCIIRCTSSTHPPNAEEGWHIYETDAQRLLIYQSGLWVPIYPSGKEDIRFRTFDATSSGTTMLNDTIFVLPLLTNSVYEFEAFICASASGGSLKFQWGIPANTLIRWGLQSPTSGEEGNIFTGYTNGPAFGTGWAGSAVSVNGTVTTARGYLVTDKTAGNFQFQWQSTNASFVVTLKANSMIRVWKIS